MTRTIPPVPAAELAVGDRIAGGFLPSGESAEVLFTTPYRLSTRHAEWVLVVSRFADGAADADHFLADKLIPLESVADTGLNFSREPDSTVAAPVPDDVEGHAEGTRAGGQ